MLRSYYNEDLLYKLFGINAELLIDHAWGWEPCTIAEIKAYKPSTNSICSGQVLQCPYDAEKARLVVKEMADLLVLDIVEKKLVTDQIVLTIGYDVENLNNDEREKEYSGEVTTDRYGRKIPKNAHGTANIARYTSSTRLIVDATMKLYDEIINKKLLIRRINISANRLIPESEVSENTAPEQLDIFTDYKEVERQKQAAEAEFEREKRLQNTIISLKKKFGKNTILKGMNFEEGATAKDRNQQIGGHKA